jgi:hypothetical protein
MDIHAVQELENNHNVKCDEKVIPINEGSEH